MRTIDHVCWTCVAPPTHPRAHAGGGGGGCGGGLEGAVRPVAALMHARARVQGGAELPDGSTPDHVLYRHGLGGAHLERAREGTNARVQGGTNPLCSLRALVHRSAAFARIHTRSCGVAA